MALKIDQYREYVLKRKFTQNPSFYRMEFVGGGIRNDPPFICYPDNIILPGRQFVNTPFSYFGPEFNIPLRREYQDLVANFIVYEDWKERQYFENWMDSIIPYATLTDLIGVYQDRIPNNFLSYLQNIKVVFTQRINPQESFYFEFVDAYPSLITPTQFASDKTAYTIFTVNFSYRYYSSPTNTLDIPLQGL